MIKNNILTRLALAAAAVFFTAAAIENAAALIAVTAPNFFAGMPPRKSLAAVIGLIAVAVICFMALRGVYRSGARAKGAGMPAWAGYAALFVLTYALRAAWIIIIKTPQYSDFQLFYWVTNQMASSPDPAYLTDPYFRTWAYQAGFPAFMSPTAMLFPGNIGALLFVNCAFEAGSVLCVFFLLGKFFSRGSAFALCAMYLTVPMPYMIVPVYTNQLACTFFMLLGVCALFPKPGSAFTYPGCCAAGLLFAIGNALRPEGIIFLGALCLFALFGLFSRLRGFFGRDFGHEAGNPRGRALRVLPAVVCCAVYLAAGALISGAFVWSGLNPGGLKNNFPLYKIAVGLNEGSGGRYTKGDSDFLAGLDASEPAQIRDQTVKGLILQRLSIGPGRLFDLFLKKFDIMWTERYSTKEDYPALNPFPDGAAVSLPGATLRIATVKIAAALVQSVWWLALFLLCAAFSVYSVFRREASALAVFLSCAAVITFAAYLLVEVQNRYSYSLIPIIFTLAAAAFSEARRISGRGHAEGAY